MYNDLGVVEKYIENTLTEILPNLKSFIDYFLSLCGDEFTILEIGSGTGRDAEYIKGRGYKVLASDASDTFIKKLRENTSLKIIKLNILSDELPENIQAVYLNSVFHHFTDTEMKSALVKIIAKIPPGGLVAFVTRAGMLEGFVNEKVGTPRYFKYRKQEEVEKILQDVGYDILFAKTVSDEVGNFLQFIARKKG